MQSGFACRNAALVSLVEPVILLIPLLIEFGNPDASTDPRIVTPAAPPSVLRKVSVPVPEDSLLAGSEFCMMSTRFCIQAPMPAPRRNM